MKWVLIAISDSVNVYHSALRKFLTASGTFRFLLFALHSLNPHSTHGAAVAIRSSKRRELG